MSINLKNKIKRIKGFTLIELLISISIILLVTSFTLPGFSEYTKRKNFERAVDTFAVNIGNLRARAVAGATPVNTSVSVQDGDLWGVVVYCTSSTSPGYSGLYYMVYGRANGDIDTNPNTTGYADYANLNENQGTGTKLKYRFNCSGGTTVRRLFFDKFTGKGATSAGEFNLGDSVTFNIVEDSTGWSKNVVIYKTGVIDVL